VYAAGMGVGRMTGSVEQQRMDAVGARLKALRQRIIEAAKKP
jgi:hypothetical protein